METNWGMEQEQPSDFKIITKVSTLPVDTLCRPCLKQIGIVTFFLFSFRLLEKTPLRTVYYPLETVYLVSLLLFFLVYIADRFLQRKNFSYLELFIISLTLMPLYSALLAQIEFKQPLLYGLLAERRWLLVLSGILLFYLLKNGKILLVDCEHAFILIAWLCLISFTLMILTLDPKNFLDIEGLVTYSELRGGYRFKFQHTFIVFATVYYFIKYFRTKNTSNLIYFYLFAGYIILAQQGRSLIISTFMSLGIYSFLNLRLKTKLTLVFYSLLVLIGFFCLSFIIKPDFIENYTTLFGNIILFFQGIRTGEPSVDMRLNLLSVILGYLIKDWRYILLGVGRLSEQWHEGFINIFKYFYPSDLGVIGSIFLYGLLGWLYVNIQFLITYLYYRRISILKNIVFLKALAYYLIALFIQSAVIGNIFSSPACSLMIIVIIYYYYDQETRRKPLLFNHAGTSGMERTLF
jgi:hypothetical protein